tara:strand:+ start:1729 stop:2196 length:468 start_codon:yes stop_codon:yes gene_type:complete
LKDEFQQKICTNYLRLQATPLDDLKVLSALLHDSIVPIADILYTPSQKQVIMVLQRFRWELTKNVETIGKPIGYQGCLCGLVIDKVESMQTHQIDMNDRSQFLNFLTFYDGAQHLDLQFSDSKVIRLRINSLKLTATDMGKNWPTTQRLKHEETT